MSTVVFFKHGSLYVLRVRPRILNKTFCISSQKTRYETYSMLLRAKQRCGDENLSVFEDMLLEEGALQRAQSSPTLQDSSMTCSTRDGASQSAAPQDPPGNSNGCSRGQGQRHSYRQAVRK